MASSLFLILSLSFYLLSVCLVVLSRLLSGFEFDGVFFHVSLLSSVDYSNMAAVGQKHVIATCGYDCSKSDKYTLVKHFHYSLMRYSTYIHLLTRHI